MLEEIYALLIKNPDDMLYSIMHKIPRSDVYHVTHAVNAKFGTDYSYQEMEQLMREEGCFDKKVEEEDDEEQGQCSTHEQTDCTPTLTKEEENAKDQN